MHRQTTVFLKNIQNENLDVLVEGDFQSSRTIVFVHGFGTDKHETAHLFDDIASDLAHQSRVVRFDFSGYGKSGGRQECVTYQKQADDLQSVLSYVRESYPGPVYILAQSMGCFVTCLLSPGHIDKTILLGIPNANIEYIISRLQDKILARPGGVVNEKGISFYPRTSGTLQKIGPEFWKVARHFNPVKAVSQYAQKTDLLIIHSLQDEVVGNEFIQEYKKIPCLSYEEVAGNHSFNTDSDRRKLISVIEDFFA